MKKKIQAYGCFKDEELATVCLTKFEATMTSNWRVKVLPVTVEYEVESARITITKEQLLDAFAEHNIETAKTTKGNFHLVSTEAEESIAKRLGF